VIKTPEDYAAETGRSATMDVGSAMATALARLVGRASIASPGSAGTPLRFKDVLTDWATFDDRNVYPTACVVSEAEIRYDESRLTPGLLEETWARRGEPGLGLYKEAEGTTEFKVFLRAPTKKERSAVVLAVETLFSRPASVGIGMQPPRRRGDSRVDVAARYGVLEPMPEYWGLSVRLSTEGTTKLDGADAASKNRWEAFMRVSAQASKVRLDRVVPAQLRVRTTVDDSPGD
jgi:hypothetical protein